MLTLTKLASAQYFIRSVADGVEDYFMGAGEAPGVWSGRWAAELGLEGVVDSEHLRHLVEGRHPHSREDLLAGRPARQVNAFDVTLSCPKSVSLLWAFGTDHTASTVTIAQAEATSRALAFLAERAAVARQQTGGVRRRVATHGFAVAAFVHRTSRDGDPQLHTHCLIPNVVRRVDDTLVAFDASALHEWAKPAGTVFQNELQRLLTARLGLEWGPERNGTREAVGFTDDQLRRFSKRALEIEAYLEAAGEEYLTPAERMKANDAASLATRRPKDPALTPERLRGRWAQEAQEVGLVPGEVERVACRRAGLGRAPSRDEVFAALLDPDTGLCARESSFSEAHVVTHLAARSAGRLTVEEITRLAGEFVASDHVVRLIADLADRRRPAEWSTVAHRRLEDRVLAGLHTLMDTPGYALAPRMVKTALAAHPELGADQVSAVRVLCGQGPAVRTVLAPAGHGKTTMVRAAVEASEAAGRRVVALATTNQAAAELRRAGVDATTITRFALDVGSGTIPPGTTVVVDEVSQVSTRDAAIVLDAIVDVPGAQLWVLGDPRQAQAVAAAGLARRIEQLADSGALPAGELTVNRRQVDPDDRAALGRLRAGDIDGAHTVRAGRGWEHEHATLSQTRQALARAAVASADTHGAERVAVLAVSHAHCEDLADRIRALLRARGDLRGRPMAGPGWGARPRGYTTGDRILLHDNLRLADGRLHNGTTATITHVHDGGVDVRLDDGRPVELPAWFVQGRRPDGRPNLSHAWARTVDGAQGGTWAEVHLLGTPALDRYRAYVGESRGRQPTHTWHVAFDRDLDVHGGLAPDKRTATQQVLDGMHREPAKTFAADRDPLVLDQQLSAERAAHEKVIATRPPERHRHLVDAQYQLQRAERELVDARDGFDGAQRRLARVGPFAGLRRSGRAERASAERGLEWAADRLDHARRNLPVCEQRVDSVQHQVDARQAWQDQHGWRVDRVAAIDDQLDHHWARTVLAAARDGDPLAYGIERLQQAEATFRADLDALDRAVPADHSRLLRRAEADLASRQRDLRHAEHRPGSLGELVAARAAVKDAQLRVHEHQHGVDTREATIKEQQPARRETERALRTVSTALDLVQPRIVERSAQMSTPADDLGIGLSL